MTLTAEDRVRHYVAQNNGGDLTPAQCRRIRKHEHRALREHNLTRVSRLRKAFDRKQRRELRGDAEVFIATIRASRTGGRRSLARRMFRRLLG